MILRWVLRPLLKLLFGLHVQGGAQLDRFGQVLIVANHNSHLDALLLLSALPARLAKQTRPVAALDHFGRSALLRRAMERLLNPVWVDRAGSAEAAVDAMSAAVAEGSSLILFPEGTRGAPGELAPFKRGVGWLLERHPELVVIPACIVGSERALPRGGALPLPVWNRVLLAPARRVVATPREAAASLEAELREVAAAEHARRHTRAARRRDAPAIAVLGIDGSGKSTLASNLARALSEREPVCLVGDRLERFVNGAAQPLQLLATERVRRELSRRAKAARSLGGYKLPKLAEMLMRELLQSECRRWLDPAWIVLDGSPLLNLAAWVSLYREGDFDPDFCAAALLQLAGRETAPRRYPALRQLRLLVPFRLALPAAAVRIELPATDAVARIASRGAARQVHETEASLDRLQQGYAAVCQVVAERLGLTVLTLDGRDSPESLATAAAEIVLSREAAHVRH